MVNNIHTKEEWAARRAEGQAIIDEINFNRKIVKALLKEEKAGRLEYLYNGEFVFTGQERTPENIKFAYDVISAKVRGKIIADRRARRDRHAASGKTTPHWWLRDETTRQELDDLLIGSVQDLL